MTEQAGEPPDPWVLQHEFTSKRLSRLAAALKAQSYLEIGVHTGGTFARVHVPERTAVDPAFRAAAGPDGSVAWHGDTFTVVFALHDFHLALDYRTIVGSGNPQTLVWRSSAGRRRPLLDSLEKISRLTYFDMVNQSQVLRQCDEETALGQCLEAIAPLAGPVPPA